MPSAPFRGSIERERERERGALADLALYPDLAAVQLDELPREREPEARALVLLGVVAPDLPELLEDRFLILGSNAHARVADRDLGHPVGDGRADPDPSALRGELD